MRVLLTHSAEDRAAYYVHSLPELEALADVIVNPHDRNFDDDELIDAAQGCDAIVCHRGTPITATILDRCPALVAVFRCAVDISDIDTDAASRLGIAVGHAEKSFVPSTAELALGLMIDLARNISMSTYDYRHGTEPPQRSGRQLAGKTAGVIGFGAIGSYLADLLAALGMHVVVHDPEVEPTTDAARAVPWPELLASADVIFPLAPAMPSTTHLIDADAIAAMKRGALLVNVSRGELLDEGAVADALDSGQLGGLAMDVGSAPDQRPASALAARPGVVATPHLGGLTPENAYAQAASSVEQIAAMARAEVPPRLANEAEAHRLHRFLERGKPA